VPPFMMLVSFVPMSRVSYQMKACHFNMIPHGRSGRLVGLDHVLENAFAARRLN